MEKVDALIVGGGIAGATTAAALARKGLRTLVCEAGLPNDKRLAGELMHAPSAARLEQLGLLAPLVAAGAVPIHGFAVFRGPRERATLLSYADVAGGRTSGLSLDHALMTRTLLSAVSSLPGVTVWEGARVQAVDLERHVPRAQVVLGGVTLEVDAALVVSAEGRESKLRARARIAAAKAPAFRMLGWKVPGGQLPAPGFGHVFLGGGAPILAYPMGGDAVRVMFECGANDELGIPASQLEALPEPFRSDVQRAMASSKAQSAKVYGMLPARYARGRMALVGDAGGCVHPLTASGIAYCTADAVELAESVARDGLESGSVARALARYQRRRRGPMFTRATLGPALLDALVGEGPGVSLLRSGLFRYWESERGRRRSMGLLSTHDQSSRSLLLEYAAVALHALGAIGDGAVPACEVPSALAGLTRKTAGYAWRGARARALQLLLEASGAAFVA